MNMFAFVRGKDDYSKGVSLDDNPYKALKIDDYLSWRYGWLHMEARD